MNRKSERRGVLLPAALLAFALAAACSRREEPQVDPNPYPNDYKAGIVKFIPKVVSDPSNIRNASISDPAFMQVGSESRYFVCVRFTPKKTATEYGNPEERIAIFYAGQITQFVLATHEQCGNAAYGPFPELERIVCVQGNCRQVLNGPPPGPHGRTYIFTVTLRFSPRLGLLPVSRALANS
jgi:hypothetical protein